MVLCVSFAHRMLSFHSQGPLGRGIWQHLPFTWGGGNPEREWPKCIVHCTEDVTKRPS